MKNMKLVLVILMLFALVVYGCGTKTPPSAEESAGQTVTETADVNTNTPASVDINAPAADASAEQTAPDAAQVETTKKTDSANVASTEFVEIKNFGFNQATLTVTKGTTVTWSQEDNAKHNVVSDDDYFESPLLEKGEKWSYTFNDAGTYNYHCALHPYMTGTIVVE
ncbi:cupredoxin family copper-binding protein [Candidatus Woesearchaeota archaeon]|nr:cupredoxin family copper-binding protein [Candidatus Woesearchaeota archaeon]